MVYDPVATQILDVGAGFGKYRILLHEYDAVDAIEIWEPTIKRENLNELYREVLVGDVFDIVHGDQWQDRRYDIVVMGDVLEHLTRDRAQLTLQRIYEHCDDVIVIVPYCYAQGTEEGNTYQQHLQDDLTPELMTSVYPELSLVSIETRDYKPFKGLYRRSEL